MSTPRTLDFSAARVLVVGDVMLDRYWHGATSRISPEAPVPVVHVQNDESRIGGAGNVAANIAALGAHATLVGLVGDDDDGRTLRQQLVARGVDSRLVTLPDARTITKLRVVSRHQQLIRLDFEAPFAAQTRPRVEQQVRLHLPGHRALVLSDYAKGTLAAAPQLIDMARAAGIPIVVDPKGTDFSRYRGATVLTPNMQEFEAVAGRVDSEEALIERGQNLRETLDLQALLITRSERGMLLIERDRPALPLAARAREVFDVTGAGDTVVAVLAAGLGVGLRLADATALANLAAGIVVGKLGTASVTLDELHRALHEHAEVPTGIVNEEALVGYIRACRAAGERIVMTNGCFDLLHPGHVHYLQQARALGDRLIVAVNDDASVARLKGPSRPVNDLQSRMTLLAALASVDWVVPFSEDTPERLICKLLPDVLVKGGDYRPDQIAGADCVQRAGGEVRILDFVDGHSSTRVIDRIKERT